MPTSIHGLHHVTAIAGDGQVALDFYTGVLGLRLVKKSVNQDAPDTYHLFFADAAGSPGTDLTFFIWPDLPPAKLGIGFTVEVPFAVPVGSLEYWQDRLTQAGIAYDPVEDRFGERVMSFQDPYGLQLALVEVRDAREFVPWQSSPVPAEHQIRGMHAVRLWERDLEPTEALLTTVMGFSRIGEEAGWIRYGVEGGASGKLIEVKVLPGERRGQWGTGGVHHVAWRVSETSEQMAVRALLEEAGLNPTPQIDRFWFKSVYFKEPGGALFELATDGPGFDRDEDPAHLGEQLILPPWYEPNRREIEAVLPPLGQPRILGQAPR